MISLHRIIAVGLFAFSSTCSATLPLRDIVEFEGAVSGLSVVDGQWLQLLENEKTREIRRRAGCTAIGAPRGRWRVIENRLWLTGLFKCGEDIKLEAVYGGDGSPIFADWITADLVTERGTLLCMPRLGHRGVQEQRIIFKVERGRVRDVSLVSNQNHPAIPTVANLRKILGPNSAHEAEALIADWPCFEKLEVEYLQSNASAEGPNGISFDDYVKSLFDPSKRLRTH